MPQIFANDFSGIGAQLANQEAQRQHASEAALATLMQGLGRMQQQKQFDQQMQERSGVAAQEMGLRERQLNMNQQYQDWLMKQTPKADVTAAKELLRQKASGLADLVDRRLPINWADYADLPPAITGPLKATDDALRTKEVGDIKTAQEAANAGRALRIINQRASELEKAAKEAPSGAGVLGFLGGIPGALGVGTPAAGRESVTGQVSPADAAKAMRERAQPFVQRYAPFLDPKKGYVMPDPATGDFSVHPDLIKPWMTGTNATGRQLNMVGPGGPAGPPVAAPGPARAMPGFAAAVPMDQIPIPPARTEGPTATGTNAPGQPVRVRLSDGRVLRTTSDRLDAVTARDPNAVVIEADTAFRLPPRTLTMPGPTNAVPTNAVPTVTNPPIAMPPPVSRVGPVAPYRRGSATGWVDNGQGWTSTPTAQPPPMVFSEEPVIAQEDLGFITNQLQRVFQTRPSSPREAAELSQIRNQLMQLLAPAAQ